MKFSEPILLNNKIYFTPYGGSVVGVLDLDNHEFSTISLGNHVSGKGKFNGGVVLGKKIYFTPRNVDVIGVLDTETNIFSTIN